MSDVNFIVRIGPAILGEFQSYAEAYVLWVKTYRKHRSVVIQDVKAAT